ncbi:MULTISPECIES: hypothetical protein [unclassified Bradyrhizobium]|uniref:hypothetical protein n=1 Tax=unclassified Bradyrhizobium TaxID=2631580 RepID=UPI00209D8C04|nr:MULTISPECIES: hypothetical protein [unclassified Bradyrhizobium]MCP1843887.1 hypothetical protein [Bradyrhizobium sp. USDA 4538]MCP1904453.1 hypothetical protein [Bradyrhizobium sp. USDA 4537]MCP1989891.1 hypothetical protein [Bradyrhizobium sp. USDA 4539]
MDRSFYLVGFALVLIILVYGLCGSLRRRRARRDEEIRRLIDERIDRMDMKRDKKHD